MESRSSTLLPTSLGFRSQIFREDPPSLNIVPFAPKSPNMLHTPRSSRRFSGVPQLSENHYMTPRPLGRSALYSIARSPSTKTHSKATHKVCGWKYHSSCCSSVVIYFIFSFIELFIFYFRVLSLLIMPMLAP